MARTDTSTLERQRFIMDWLAGKPSIAVADIVRRFGISEVTARHDLIVLESAGKVRRTRGGAVSLSRSIALVYPEERANVNTESKEAIGRLAATLVDDGDVIIADIGTTAYYFVKQLTGKHGITIITGDLSIANYANFNLPDAKVTLLGGTIRHGDLYLAGSLTLDNMSRLYADKAFVSADGFHSDRGFTVEHDFSVSIKRAYNANSRLRVMMLDASKFDKTSFFQFADLSDFDVVVTDSDSDTYMSLAAKKAHHRPRLIVADDAKRRKVPSA